MEIGRLKQVLWLTVVIMVTFALYYYMVGYRERIPEYMEFIRLGLMVTYIMIICWSINRTLSRPVFLTISFLLFWGLSVVIQSCYLNATHLVFAGIDSWSYMEFATRYYQMDVWTYWKQLLWSGRFNVDDLGYSTWVYMIAKLVGNNTLAIAHGLMFVNSIAYIIGVAVFYKLSCLVLQDTWRAEVATGLWGGFSFLIVTNAVGLKEVLFTTIIIVAMYRIYKYKRTPSWLNLIICLLSIGLTYFFRYAICFALLLALLVIVVTTEQNRKRMLWVMFAAMFFTMPLLSIVLPVLINKSLEDVMATADYRMGLTGGTAIQSLLFPILALFFGPFPNLDRTNQYGFMYGFALLFKDLLSPYFLYAVYWMIRRVAYQYFPLIVFVGCNMLMLIVSGVSADMRYHVTYMPFFFLLMLWPGGKTVKTIPYIVYIGMIIVIVFMYATRSVSEVTIINDLQYIMVK